MFKSVNVVGTLSKGRRPPKVFLSKSNYSKICLFCNFSVLLAFGIFRAFCFFWAFLVSPIFACWPPRNHARVWGADLAPPIVATSSQFSTSGMVTFAAGEKNAESAIRGDSSPPLPIHGLVLLDSVLLLFSGFAVSVAAVGFSSL